MALQTNGSISASDVNEEFGLPGTTQHSFEDAHEGLGNFNLNTLVGANPPNGVTPHSLGEFYGYNHSFTQQNLENVENFPTTQNLTQAIIVTNTNSCIVRGQKVRLSSGLLIEISRLRKGDELLGYAIENMPIDHNITDGWKIATVKNVRVKPHPVKIIRIETGTHDMYIDINRDVKNNIQLTQEHPLFIKRKIDQTYTYKWMRADEVEINDYMLRANYFDKHDVVWKQSEDKDWILVENIHVVKEQCIAYGLDVDCTDTYVVGNIVVHNGPNSGKGGGGGVVIENINFDFGFDRIDHLLCQRK